MIIQPLALPCRAAPRPATPSSAPSLEGSSLEARWCVMCCPGEQKKLARRITHHDLCRILLHDCTRPIDPGSISIHASSSPRLEAHWRVSVVRGELTAGRKNNASTTFLFGSRHVIYSQLHKTPKPLIFLRLHKCSASWANTMLTSLLLRSWQILGDSRLVRVVDHLVDDSGSSRRPFLECHRLVADDVLA